MGVSVDHVGGGTILPISHIGNNTRIAPRHRWARGRIARGWIPRRCNDGTLRRLRRRGSGTGHDGTGRGIGVAPLAGGARGGSSAIACRATAIVGIVPGRAAVVVV